MCSVGLRVVRLSPGVLVGPAGLEPVDENPDISCTNPSSPISVGAISGAVETEANTNGANADLLAAFVASLSPEQRDKLIAMLTAGHSPDRSRSMQLD